MLTNFIRCISEALVGVCERRIVFPLAKRGISAAVISASICMVVCAQPIVAFMLNIEMGNVWSRIPSSFFGFLNVALFFWRMNQIKHFKVRHERARLMIRDETMFIWSWEFGAFPALAWGMILGIGFEFSIIFTTTTISAMISGNVLAALLEGSYLVMTLGVPAIFIIQSCAFPPLTPPEQRQTFGRLVPNGI
jgi:hypothetical protein